MFKIFFEDIAVGDEEKYGSYHVTREEIIEFAGKYDPQPFHLDDEIAKMSVFGKLCASGWHTCSMVMRMLVDHMMDVGFAGMGSPGIDNLRWRKPVFPGDTLSVHTTITAKKDMPSRPNMGIVQAHYKIFNHLGETVMTMDTNVMVLLRSGK